MSLLGIAAGLLGFGGIAAVAGAIFAPAVTRPILRAGLSFAGRAIAFALEHWQVTLFVLAFGAAMLFGLHERGEARHQAKLAERYAGLWHDEQKHFADERAAHAVTKASLVRAGAEINDNNKRIKAAAAELEREKREAAADQARADERWRSTKASADGLAVDARRADRKPCTISDQARRALEGL